MLYQMDKIRVLFYLTKKKIFCRQSIQYNIRMRTTTRPEFKIDSDLQSFVN